MEVHKFGGSCFENQISFSLTLERIIEYKPKIIVVSAAFGVTDLLHNALNDFDKIDCNYTISQIKLKHSNLLINNKFNSTDFDVILEDLEDKLQGIKDKGYFGQKLRESIIAYGERLMAAFINPILNSRNLISNVVDASDIILISEERKILMDQMDRSIIDSFEGLTIIPGYYGSNNQGEILTLGRSGTDYTATALGNLVDSEKIVIWKDVIGFRTGDPRIIKNTNLILTLSHEETNLLAKFGAKILHSQSITPIMEKNLVLEIKNLFDPSKVTVISSQKGTENVIKAISFLHEVNFLKLYGSPEELSTKLGSILERIRNNGFTVKYQITEKNSIVLILHSELSDIEFSYLVDILLQDFGPNIHFQFEMGLSLVFSLSGGEKSHRKIIQLLTDAGRKFSIYQYQKNHSIILCNPLILDSLLIDIHSHLI